MANSEIMKDIVSLAKRRGFIYQGSDIYQGLAGTYDYGPLGILLKNNIKNSWWQDFVTDREDMYGLDASILMNAKVWQSSGHVAGFSDPLVEDLKTKKRFRADHLLEEAGFPVEGLNLTQMTEIIQSNNIKSPDGNPLSEARQFNMMFETAVGAVDGDISYLRPETAQGIFVNFKNVVDSFHPKLPFGIGQIGKAFRNEITPRDFLFRVREFEQMEVEYFVHPDSWQINFAMWQEAIKVWAGKIGIDLNKLSELEIGEEDRAHYSQRTIDFQFEYPFGVKELFGLAYRGNYDLTKHTEGSGVDLSYLDQETGEKFIPHVIEPSLGVDRAVLSVLVSSYREDDLGGDKRVYLDLPFLVAPIKVAVFPLLKNKPQLIEKGRQVFSDLKSELSFVMWDDNGNIGKRYRRQDEIGTPYCVTIDFDTLEDNTVTVRQRNTGEQKRIAISELLSYIKNN